jgi:tRNA threonylcarbamoyladenosine biosynthesis protein TsaB
MAIILNIETATPVCSVALAKDGKLQSRREVNAGYTHSENLTNFISEVCNEAGITLKQLDAVAVSSGPGSYTGLRIGASTAKGLCYALQLPLIAVGTLKSLTACLIASEKIDSKTLCIPMIDARRMEVYYAVYNHALEEVHAPAALVVNSNSLSEFTSNHSLVLFGDGSSKCKPLFENIQQITFSDVTLSASGMAKLSEEKYLRKEFENVSLFEPFYLKEVAIGKAAELK